MPDINVLVDLEESLSTKLKRKYTDHAQERVDAIHAAVKAKNWDKAHEEIDAITFNGAASAAAGIVENIGVQCLLLGASQLAPLKDAVLMREKSSPILQVLGPAGQSFTNLLTHTATTGVKDVTHAIIDRLENQPVKTVQLIAKAEVDELAAMLNNAVMGTGKAFVDIGANLTTSRLVSYGFLAQAGAMNVEEYQVTEILDKATCPVCRKMHGKVFRTQAAFSKLDTILRLTDPADLKNAAPWPRQTKAGLDDLEKMTDAQIASKGWDVPPYHPLCRGTLVPKGTVDTKPQALGALEKLIQLGVQETAAPVLGAVTEPAAGVLEAIYEKEAPKTLSDATQEQLAQSMTTEEIAAVDKVLSYPEINAYKRFCMSPSLVTKDEMSYGPINCGFYNPKKMGAIIDAADEGLKKMVVKKAVSMERKAVGAFADELIANWDQLEGSVIYDKGFVLGSYNPKGLTVGANEVKIKMLAEAGTEFTMLGSVAMLPADTKLHVVGKEIVDGVHTLKLKVIKGDPAVLEFPKVAPKFPEPTIPVMEPKAVAQAAATSEAELDAVINYIGETYAAAAKDNPTSLEAKVFKHVKGTGAYTSADYPGKKAILDAKLTEEKAAEEAYNKATGNSEDYDLIDKLLTAPESAGGYGMDNNAALDYLLGIEKNSLPSVALAGWNELLADGKVLAAKKQAEKAAAEAAKKAQAAAEAAAKAAAQKAQEEAAAQAAAQAKAQTSTGMLDYTNFKQVGAKPGGSVPGALYENKLDGSKWIIKYTTEDVSRNEALAGQLYNAVGVKAPELALIKTPDGQVYLGSKMMDGYQPAEAKLKTGKLAGVNEGFVADAWLANWDAAGLAFDNIGEINGQAVRIDVGGSLRYRAQGGLKGAAFGTDVTELDSLRNASVNAQTAKTFAKVSEADMIAGAKRIAALPDEEIERLVKLYGPADAKTNKELADTLKARKQYLIKRFKLEEPALAQPVPVAEAGARVTSEEQRKVISSRSNGYSLLTDKDQIEDHSVLVHIEHDARGTDRTVATLKVRGSGADAMEKHIAEAKKSAPRSYNPMAQAAAKVEEFDRHDIDTKLVTAIKGINSRAAAGTAWEAKDVERASLARDAYLDAHFSLEKAVKAGLHTAADLAKFEAHYQPWIKALESVKTGVIGQKIEAAGPGKLFSALPSLPKQAPKTAAPVAAPKAAWEFKRVTSAFDTKQITAGKAKATGNTYEKGYAYEAVKDGVRVRYWSDAGGMNALRNRLDITTEGGTALSTEKVMQTLDELGINSTRPSALDREELYLRQWLYARNDKDYPTVIAEVNALGTQDDRVALLKKTLAKKAKVKAVEDLPRYNPQGSREAFDQGYARFERPDLNDAEWDSFKTNYVLHHSETTGRGVAEVTDAILNSGGVFTPTTEKLRKGITPGGMSPDADLRSGGADYFFTRIKPKSDRTSGWTWKADKLARVDAISYSSDLYGETSSEEFVRRNRNSTVKEWIKAASNYSNETILKNGVSIFDGLQNILASSETERKSVIAVLKKHKIDIWPDGRKLEEVVIVGGH